MTRLNLLARPLDRFASRSPKRARARAERLSETAPERALALFAAAAEAGDVEAAFIVGERFLEGKGTLRHPFEAARWYSSRRRGRACARAMPPRPTPSPRPAAGRGRAERGAVRAGRRPRAPTITRPCSGRDARPMRVRRMPRPCSPISCPTDRKNCAIPMRRLSWYRKSAEQDCPQGRLGYAIALMLRADTAEEMFAARDELLRAAEAGLPTAHYLLGVSAERADRHGAGRGGGAAALQDRGRGRARQRAGEAWPAAARRPRRTGRPR